MKSIIAGVAVLLATGMTVSAADDVAALWKEHCTSCHGANGKGKTKAGRKAKVKDFTDAEYQKKFTDEFATKRLKEGIMEDGKERMKPFGDKLKDDEIKELLAYVRKFAKK
jgi:mono/diheme cytochrome c family protein